VATDYDIAMASFVFLIVRDRAYHHIIVPVIIFYQIEKLVSRLVAMNMSPGWFTSKCEESVSRKSSFNSLIAAVKFSPSFL
jgi:hypothetical protein